MDETIKFSFILVISFEVAFVRNIYVNMILIMVGVLYLLMKRIPYKKILSMIAVGALPFLGTWLSFYFNGQNNNISNAWIFSSRVYVYIILGGILAFTISLEKLLQSFEQNWHVPSKFIYGTLGAFYFIPRVRQAIKQIQAAAWMRGEDLHAWSPVLFLKAIFLSVRWSEELAEAMYSHGYREDSQRTFYREYKIPLWNYFVAVGLTIAFQILIFW